MGMPTGVLPVFSVQNFGAQGNDTADDTAAIQAAIDAARHPIVAPQGGIVFFPPGIYDITQLDLTNAQGVILQGSGVASTWLRPTANVNAVLDLTGSLQVKLADFQLGPHKGDVTTPLCGILAAQVASGCSNALELDNLYVSGRYGLATFYNYGVPSSCANHVCFYNTNPAGGATLYFSLANPSKVPSNFTTVATGACSTSDWTFTGCEVHDFTGLNITSAVGVRLDGATQMRWFGGNVSCLKNAQAYVRTENGAGHVLFAGTTFYTDEGPAPNFIVFAAADISNIKLDGCQIASSAISSVFGGAAGITYDQVDFRCKVGSIGNVVGNGLAMNLRDSFLNCDGGQLNMPGGSISHTLLINPGPITAGSNGATVI